MKEYDKKTLAAAAVVALGIYGFAAPAQAFDNVNWNWNANVYTNIKEKLEIDHGKMHPKGLTMLEIKQKQIGDVKASSKVEHVMNNAAATGRETVDLPEVLSEAVAVGNNADLDSNVTMRLHAKQVVTGPNGSVANVAAASEVEHILNASVDSSATAVGNNMDVKMAAMSPGDNIFIGDVTQISRANVAASSKVEHVMVNGYANLGDLKKPLVSSVATAVGNNFSLKVKGK